MFRVFFKCTVSNTELFTSNFAIVQAMWGTFDAQVAIYAEGGRKRNVRKISTIMKSLATTYATQRGMLLIPVTIRNHNRALSFSRSKQQTRDSSKIP